MKFKAVFGSVTTCTECPKIYRKYVLHLIYKANMKHALTQMQYRFAVIYEILSTRPEYETL